MFPSYCISIRLVRIIKKECKTRTIAMQAAIIFCLFSAVAAQSDLSPVNAGPGDDGHWDANDIPGFSDRWIPIESYGYYDEQTAQPDAAQSSPTPGGRPEAPDNYQRSGVIGPSYKPGDSSISPSGKPGGQNIGDNTRTGQGKNTRFREYHDILFPSIKYQHEPKYDYANALAKSMLFYEAQRSGELPYDHRIPWRGDSAVDDGADLGIDLSGGYYDGGGYIKYGFPMAYTTTILSWGIIRYRRSYEAIGQLQHALKTIKWATDYFLKCKVGPTKFYGQVSDQQSDSSYIGKPEDMNYPRKAYPLTEDRPGSELVAETAAAMAAASIVFYETDREYSELLIDNAKELYDFAGAYRRRYHDSIKPAESAYRSHSGFLDELAWAATWIYRRTGDSEFLREAKRLYKSDKLNTQATSFSWDDKKVGVQMLMAEVTKKKIYINKVKEFCDYCLPSGKSRYTRQGLLFVGDWGPLRYAANAAFICSLAAEMGVKSNEYRLFALNQTNYILGSTGRSYVVGFGENPPTKYYHKSSYCPDPPSPCPAFSANFDNAKTLYGALVGGPSESDTFFNSIEKRSQSSVAVDYNAGYQSVLAALLDLHIFGTTSRPEIDEPGKISIKNNSLAEYRSNDGDNENENVVDDYAKALDYSILFYESERSGELKVDSRIPWRFDSAMFDGKAIQRNLTGGYYDGGGHVKYTFPLAFTMTMLSWGVIEFHDAYEDTGNLYSVLEGINWGADYLVKANLDQERGFQKIVSQVGDIYYDSLTWDRPKYINQTTIRPVTLITPEKPGSEVAAEMAAAFAAISIAFGDIASSEYKNDLISQAKNLFDFAKEYRGLYTKHQPTSIGIYNSTGFEDELAWAAMWIYKATDDTSYLNHAKSLYTSPKLLVTPKTFSYDDKTAGLHLLFAEETYDATEMVKFCDWVINSAKTTPKGLYYDGFPPNKHAGNVAFILLLASQKFAGHPNAKKWRFYARDQISYILGSTGQSYMVGYGKNYPQQPYHKSSSCPRVPLPCGFEYRASQTANKQILFGAVVAGPDKNDNFEDVRTKTKYTAVSLDTNAGVQSSLAALHSLKQKGLLNGGSAPSFFITKLPLSLTVFVIMIWEMLFQSLLASF